MNRVKEFMLAADQPINSEMYYGMFTFRGDLIDEETTELMEAINTAHPIEPDFEKILKEMCDVVFVIKGMCLTFGWDFDTAFDRVYKNNMTKVVDCEKDNNGKVVKPKNYKPVDLGDLV